MKASLVVSDLSRGTDLGLVESGRRPVDVVARWLLVAVIVLVGGAWVHLGHLVTHATQQVLATAGDTGSTGVGAVNPMQCWLSGLSVRGDADKVAALAKAGPNDAVDACQMYALRGATGQDLDGN